MAGNIFLPVNDVDVSDCMNGSFIRRVSAADGRISTIAGTGMGVAGNGGPATNAGLGYIFGMYIDGHGDLYCNEESCASRKID